MLSSGVSVLQNRTSDTDLFDGVAVIGANNTVKNNTIRNSDESGVFLQGANNAIQDNTINDATIGLLVTAGIPFRAIGFFKMPVTKEVFEAGASVARSQNSLRRADILPAALRKGLPR